MVKRAMALAAVIMCFSAAAEAGLVYGGECGACGYAVSDLFVGTGKEPLGEHALYYADAWKAVVLVYFDLKQALAAEAGLGPGNDPEGYWTAYEEFASGWSCPRIIEEGHMPPCAEIVGEAYKGKAAPRLVLLEGGSPLEGKAYRCPRCGKVELVFWPAGKWD